MYLNSVSVGTGTVSVLKLIQSEPGNTSVLKLGVGTGY